MLVILVGDEIESHRDCAAIESVALKSDEQMEQTDLNDDKKADVFTVYVLKSSEKGKIERILSRKEIDVNFDGKIDIVRFYDSMGNLSREEMDFDFDQRLDTISHYKDGKVYLSEHSSTFDGKMDIKKHFENDALILK
ncbi:MAG: hypothetical protein FJ088_16545, partial [Deltaproteobacteria bacterium]|nr:hypothetical protein [Deltaproteobacteria bacterium]